MKIKGLTVHQPWAWAIADGHKKIENRSWWTGHRGLLAIHAGKKWDLDAVRWMRMQPGLPDAPSMDDVPRGAVVAVVELVGVCGRSADKDRVVCECGPWAQPRQIHWQLKPTSPLAVPVPCSGKQGLWEVDLDLDLPDDVMGGAR